MELTITRGVSGEETVINADNYTATVRFAPTQEQIDNIIKHMFFTGRFGEDPRLHSVSSVGYQSLYCDSFPTAFKTMTMVLVNHTNDKNVPYNMMDQKNIVGVAECPITYSGDDTLRGTYNSAESSISYSLNGTYNCHLVFDFPTHCANGSVNKILFYPAYTYTTMRTGESYFPTMHNHNFMDMKITEFNSTTPIWFNHSNNLSNSGSRYQLTVGDDGSYFYKDFISKTAYYYYKKGTGTQYIRKSFDFGQLNTSGDITNTGYVQPSYFDGSYWIPATKGEFLTNDSSNGSASVTTVTYKKLNISDNTLTVGNETKVFTLSPASYNNRRTIRVVECNNLYFHFYQVCSSSNNTGASCPLNLQIINKSDDSILRTFENLYENTNYSRTYPPVNFYFDSKAQQYYISNHTFNHNNVIVLDSNFNMKKYTQAIHYQVDCSPNGKYTKVCRYPLYYLYTSTSDTKYPSSCSGYGVIGEGTFKQPVIEIDLKEPLIKTDTETLKLTFDFNANISY